MANMKGFYTGDRWKRYVQSQLPKPKPNENGDGLTDHCWYGECANCPGSSKEKGDYGAEFGAAEPCTCVCHKSSGQ